jgi:diacylglycerol kinase family enzyme
VRAALIVNANAGATRRDPQLPERLRSVADGRAELFLTRSQYDLECAAKTLAQRNCPNVAVVGGDGTASTTLTALTQAYGHQPLPAVALLRGGTMNTVAASLGVSRRSPIALLRRTLERWHGPIAPEYRLPHTMQVGQDRLGFLFGTGVMYGWLAEYYARADGHTSQLRAAQVFGSSVLSALVEGPTYKRIRGSNDLAVRYEGGAWESRNYITVGAGTVADAGLGFRPFYLAEQHPGCFHLLAIKGKPSQLAVDLPSIWLGRGMRARTAHETETSWAELESPQGSFGYFVDGDLLMAKSRLRLALGPQFRVLCI